MITVKILFISKFKFYKIGSHNICFVILREKENVFIRISPTMLILNFKALQVLAKKTSYFNNLFFD